MNINWFSFPKMTTVVTSAVRPSDLIRNHKQKSDEAHVEALINKLERQASWRKVIRNTLLAITTVGGVVVAALTNISGVSRLWPTLLSLAVSVAAALSAVFKFGECSTILNDGAYNLAFELERYRSRQGIYKDKDKNPQDALLRFRDRVDTLVRVEYLRERQLLKPETEQK